ncbi:MAG TPA: PBP1A family penicillin-binding protein [Vicinamibacterales bacterium]|jgi:penicillin-binding protein 1A|nr:PBP1A family penicillin-binding protein [Vicinamibacterales bacterium]
MAKQPAAVRKPPARKPKAQLVIRFAGQAGVVALFIVVALLGVLSGVMFAYAGDLPQISALDNYAPSATTRVYARDGQTLAEFAIERRLIIGYDDIAPQLRQAIISAEDKDFNNHFGLSVSAIFARLATDILHRRLASGASTLTMQLARNLFAEDVGFQVGDKNWERKIKEALVAVQIEKRYTKREILTFYVNQIHLGHGTYGVEAASRLYFNKHAKDLTLEEAAMLAGIIQSPARQSPFVDPAAAMRRRNYVLEQMAQNGYITQAQADAARKDLIVTHGKPQALKSAAPFFAEEIRKYLEQKYGAKKLYEGGLSVQTGIDIHLQEAANRAIERGLRQVDKVRGWRRDKPNVLAAGQNVLGYKNDRWKQPMAADDIVPAVVTSVAPTSARLRIGQQLVDLRAPGFAWTHRSPPAMLAVGDLIDVRIVKVDPGGKVDSVALEQTPIVQGALLAIDNHTGQIRAMVGGFDFERSKFNRAVQAARQVGSGFKPFVYTAAIDRGFTPSSILIDEPVTYQPGPGQPPYQPKNYDGKFEGAVTLRHALEDSRNVPAVKMMATLTPPQVISYARKFGIEANLEPYLSLALGAADITLMEMTSAYTVFPNGGVRMKPIEFLKISDRNGNLLEETRPEPHDAIRADTAFVMTNLLRGVVQRGTGAAAAALNWPLGGKTGTTDDYGDAWFIGFDPDITVGVWVGYDERKTIGPAQTGAQAALPIWMDFMKVYIDTRDKDHPPEFAPPGNIIFLSVDKENGAPNEAGGINEAFISGTQPGTALPR